MVNKEQINNILSNVINSSPNINVKCGRIGTRESSGFSPNPDDMPQFNGYHKKLKEEELNTIADTMSKRWGLEVSIDENGNREIGKSTFNLWDDNHKTVINLGILINHQEWIDFTNTGRGAYNLDEVLSFYNELDDKAKDNIPLVLFTGAKGGSFTQVYNGKEDVFNSIKISQKAYWSPRDSDWGLKKVLGHEAGHASEAHFTQEQKNVLKKAWDGGVSYNPNKLTPQERVIFDDFIKNQHEYRNQISNSQEYIEAMGQNIVRYASDYSEFKCPLQFSNFEDFAEVMSAVSFRNSRYKKDFHITYGDGRVVDWDTFVHDHEATYKICCDYVDGKLKHTDLHSPKGVKYV